MKYTCPKCGHNVEADEAPVSCSECGGSFTQSKMPKLTPLGGRHTDEPSTIPQTNAELLTTSDDLPNLRPLGDGLSSGRDAPSKLDQQLDQDTSGAVDPRINDARDAGILPKHKDIPPPKEAAEEEEPAAPDTQFELRPLSEQIASEEKETVQAGPPAAPDNAADEETEKPLPPSIKPLLDESGGAPVNTPADTPPAPSESAAEPPRESVAEGGGLDAEESDSAPSRLSPLGDKKRQPEASTAVPDDAPEPAGLRRLGKTAESGKLNSEPEEHAKMTPKGGGDSHLGVNRSGSFMSGDAGQHYQVPTIRIAVQDAPQAPAQILVNAIEMAFARERILKKVVVMSPEGMKEPLKEEDVAIRVVYADGSNSGSPVWTIEYEDGQGRQENFPLQGTPDPQNTPEAVIAGKLKTAAAPALNQMLKLTTGRILLNHMAGKLVLVGFVIGVLALVPVLGFVLAPAGLACSITGLILMLRRGIKKRRILGVVAILLNLAAPFTFLLL